MANKKSGKAVLRIPVKKKKRNKGYYLSEEVIEFIKSESKRLSTKLKPVSENEVFTAIVNFYQENS